MKPAHPAGKDAGFKPHSPVLHRVFHRSPPPRSLRIGSFRGYLKRSTAHIHGNPSEHPPNKARVLAGRFSYDAVPTRGVEFASDSSLEGDGFEPSVPGAGMRQAKSARLAVLLDFRTSQLENMPPFEFPKQSQLAIVMVADRFRSVFRGGAYDAGRTT